VTQIKNLPKDKTYLIYCRSGNRSAQACEIMGEEGFENVKNLSGGIMRWPFDTV
jgi:rhodanese-related sulfurtransferase